MSTAVEHPSPLPHVAAIPPYPPGRPIDAVAREFGLDPGSIVKLASNENPLGPSPAALAALAALSPQSHLYPDFDCYALKDAIAAHVGLAADQVLPGAGSSELILLAARAFLEPGRAAVIPRYAFQSYRGAVASMGAETLVVDNDGWTPDLDALLAAASDPRVHVLYLATPNNPTGVALAGDDVLRFADRLPDRVLLVLDEAYRDFVEPDARPDLKALLAARSNLLVMRTFSKIYGLAALRVGYGLGDAKLISLLRGLQLPFSVSAPAQAAAIAALGDQEFAERSRAENAAERSRLAGALADDGIEFVPSAGNFLLMRVGDGAGVTRELMRRGVIVRPMGSYGLAEWIRVTVGLRHENDRFLRELRALPGASAPIAAEARA